jgi:hypothetical protein
MKAICLSASRAAATAPYHKGVNDWDGETHITLMDLHYITQRGEPFVVPQGFITDQGSIPSFARGLVDDDDESITGFIGHDYLVSKDCPVKMTRKEADDFLYQVIRGKKQSWWRSVKTRFGVWLGDIAIDYFEKPIVIDKDYVEKILEQMIMDIGRK